MIIHNSTFMIRKEREGDVISWLKKELGIDSRNTPDCKTGGLVNPRISAMREAGGISHEHADAASVAFQSEFEDVPSALAWRERVFNPLAERFSSVFGEESMVFCSLFEVK